MRTVGALCLRILFMRPVGALCLRILFMRRVGAPCLCVMSMHPIGMSLSRILSAHSVYASCLRILFMRPVCTSCRHVFFAQPVSVYASCNCVFSPMLRLHGAYSAGRLLLQTRVPQYHLTVKEIRHDMRSFVKIVKEIFKLF
jgi:hypothetical protein